MLRRFAQCAVLLLGAACSHSRDGKVRVELPKGSKYKEALLTSTWFDNVQMIGPIGGPTRGYDLALQLWPEGPTLTLLGAIGKDELASDPTYLQLKKKELALKAEPDGHALAYSFDDGHTWYPVWIDGPEPFECGHVPVTPGAIPPTRAAAQDILAHRASHPVRHFEANRGDLDSDSVELEGAEAAVGTAGSDAREPTPAEPTPTKLSLAAPRTDPLPEKLTPLQALEWLGFPAKVDASSCARWKEVDARAAAAAEAVVIPPPPNPKPKVEMFSPVYQLPSAYSQLMLTVVSVAQWPPTGDGAILDAYTHEAAGCGHVDNPDLACRERLRKEKERLWWESWERSRLRLGASIEGIHSGARAHLENAEKAMPADEWSRAQVTQTAWNIVRVVAAATKNVSCPAERGPSFTEPLR